MSTTPNLDIPLLTEGATEPHVEVNDALYHIAALAQGSVKDILNAEPGSPSEGDRYLIGSTATGTNWSGHDDEFTYYHSGVWVFVVPFEGMRLWVDDDDDFIVYNGSTWETVTTT